MRRITPDGEGARPRVPLLLHPAPKPDDGAEMSASWVKAADYEDAIPPRVYRLDAVSGSMNNFGPTIA